MPALINNRLAAAFRALEPDHRGAKETALAAFEVMKGAAETLGLAATGVAYFEPDAVATFKGYVVAWPDGPREWAIAASDQALPKGVLIDWCRKGYALQIWEYA